MGDIFLHAWVTTCLWRVFWWTSFIVSVLSIMCLSQDEVNWHLSLYMCSCMNMISDFISYGYGYVECHYIWLQNSNISSQWIDQRVQEGFYFNFFIFLMKLWKNKMSFEICCWSLYAWIDPWPLHFILVCPDIFFPPFLLILIKLFRVLKGLVWQSGIWVCIRCILADTIGYDDLCSLPVLEKMLREERFNVLCNFDFLGSIRGRFRGGGAPLA